MGNLDNSEFYDVLSPFKELQKRVLELYFAMVQYISFLLPLHRPPVIAMSIVIWILIGNFRQDSFR